jgi:hypothetical protein
MASWLRREAMRRDDAIAEPEARLDIGGWVVAGGTATDSKSREPLSVSR